MAFPIAGGWLRPGWIQWRLWRPFHSSSLAVEHVTYYSIYDQLLLLTRVIRQSSGSSLYIICALWSPNPAILARSSLIQYLIQYIAGSHTFHSNMGLQPRQIGRAHCRWLHYWSVHFDVSSWNRPSI